MTKYKIQASYVSYVETTIEAENIDEAKEIAHNMDGGDFEDTGYGDWNVDNIEEQA